MPYPKIYSIHPGEILKEEFLKPLKLSEYRLAKEIGVPARRINEIVKELRGISADTALRLSRYFKTTPEFWLGLQSSHDLYLAEQKQGAHILKKIVPFVPNKNSQRTRHTHRTKIPA